MQVFANEECAMKDKIRQLLDKIKEDWELVLLTAAFFNAALDKHNAMNKDGQTAVGKIIKNW